MNKDSLPACPVHGCGLSVLPDTQDHYLICENGHEFKMTYEEYRILCAAVERGERLTAIKKAGRRANIWPCQF